MGKINKSFKKLNLLFLINKYLFLFLYISASKYFTLLNLFISRLKNLAFLFTPWEVVGTDPSVYRSWHPGPGGYPRDHPGRPGGAARFGYGPGGAGPGGAALGENSRRRREIFWLSIPDGPGGAAIWKFGPGGAGPGGAQTHQDAMTPSPWKFPKSGRNKGGIMATVMHRHISIDIWRFKIDYF